MLPPLAGLGGSCYATVTSVWQLVHKPNLLVGVRVWRAVRVIVEFGKPSAFRGWVRVTMHWGVIKL